MQKTAARSAPLPNDVVLRAGAGLIGAVLTACATLAADLAQAHMLARGVICGVDPTPHCAWCGATLAFSLTAVGAFVVALGGGQVLRELGLVLTVRA